jgi:hypothetical protein
MSFSAEWQPRKPNPDFITRGRRTNVVIQKAVPVGADGMEDPNQFWEAAGAQGFTRTSPTALFPEPPRIP